VTRKIISIIFRILVLSLFSISLIAQIKPVTFKFTSVKLSDSKYEIHMLATIQTPWHIYSRIQPKGAINIPTVIKFKSNPIIDFDGEIKEDGNKETVHNKDLNISSCLYNDQVDFIKKVQLKAKVVTSVKGTITFQVCNDQQCLRPTTISFDIPIK